MSSLPNGTEDLVGQNLTPGAAYAVVNTAFQKLAAMNLHEQVVPFYGLPRDGMTRGASAIPIERLILSIEIRAEGDAPSGANLVVQLIIGGVTQSPTFALNAGQTYVLIPASSSDLVVPANTACAAQIVSANQASDVVVAVKSQLRIP